jgi:hypothetical protein
MIIIIMRGENFVAHLNGLGGTLVCRGAPVAHHCFIIIISGLMVIIIVHLFALTGIKELYGNICSTDC